MKNPFRRIRQTLQTTESYEAVERSRSLRISAYALVVVVLGLCIFGFFNSAPPNTIIITAGPPGSQFDRNAKRYQDILKRSGITLKILPSAGSIENIQRLNDPKQRVDVGFVQGGMAKDVPKDRVESLGSVFYQPLMIFYRADKPYSLLSEFKGKRLVVGPDGSGSQQWATTLLDLNGIKPGADTAFLESTAEEGGKALLAGQVDAVFVMGDSANVKALRDMLLDDSKGIRIFSFSQADAYSRKNQLLSKLILPRGSFDFGNNIPADDVLLVGPTVELVARKGLHPALSDLLLEAAHEIHSKPNMYQKRDEFPAPLQHEFRISDDAARYYKSGKSFIYRYMPFWMASLADRLLIVVLPIILVLIPGLRLLPALYNWRMRSRILRWYGVLLLLERDINKGGMHEQREDLLRRLASLEKAVHNLKVPLSFADQFYVLRQHIDFVREKLLVRPEDDNAAA
jgi:TRAP-type uncharacterized transport system substrate-binding protein